jgi:hypothetical protein
VRHKLSGHRILFLVFVFQQAFPRNTWAQGERVRNKLTPKSQTLRVYLQQKMLSLAACQVSNLSITVSRGINSSPLANTQATFPGQQRLTGDSQLIARGEAYTPRV